MFPDTATMVFCIGAQKAGTTWLYDTLRASPDVHFSPNKELHYFDVVAGKAQQVLDLRVRAAQTLAQRLRPAVGPQNAVALAQLGELASLLGIYAGGSGDHHPYLDYVSRGYKGQKTICDITPAYATLDRATFAEMGQIGGAKFIFILRDPVDRMWSQIRMAVSMSQDKDGDFQTQCTARAHHLVATNRLPKIERGDYQRTITELEAVIPAHRIMYLFYENLFSEQSLDAISHFLQISGLTGDLSHYANRGTTAVLPEDVAEALRSAFAPQYRFVRDRFGADVPKQWRLPPQTRQVSE